MWFLSYCGKRALSFLGIFIKICRFCPIIFLFWWHIDLSRKWYQVSFFADLLLILNLNLAFPLFLIVKARVLRCLDYSKNCLFWIVTSFANLLSLSAKSSKVRYSLQTIKIFQVTGISFHLLLLIPIEFVATSFLNFMICCFLPKFFMFIP